MLPYISEFVGTAILIILGCGVVANVCLTGSGMKGGGPIQITIAWGLAVMLPAYTFGSSSGAHFNPALTIALAADGSFPWEMVPGYCIAQFAGATLGACIVYALYKCQFAAEQDPLTKRGVFCPTPVIQNFTQNMLSEIVGTFILVFAIKGIANIVPLAGGVSWFVVFGIIVSIGMSLGGLTGYAINPARDIGPRFAHFILPIPGKTDSNWKYAIVTLFGPIIGALLAVGVFNIIPWAPAA